MTLPCVATAPLPGRTSMITAIIIETHAAEHGERELRHERAEVDESQLRLRAGDLEGQPSQRELEHVLAADLRSEPGPVEPEVADFESAQRGDLLLHPRSLT